MHFGRSDKGQIIVIIALSIVVIIGMTALAIDGTRFYSDRRSSQAAADSAALAGAGAAAQYIKNYSPSEFYCGSSLGASASTQAILAAIQNAAKDGYSLTSSTTGPSHVYVTCDSDSYRDYIDIHVQVTTSTEMSFGRVLTDQPLVGIVEAVTRVYPQQNLAFGNAIASLGTDCSDGGIDLTGNNSLNIKDGGVFSNSCLIGKGNITLEVTDAKIQYVDDLTQTGGASFTPAATKAAERLPEYTLDPPNCSTLTNKTVDSMGGTIYPGIYPSISLNAGAVLVMKPGLYCLDGDFKLNGHATVTGTNVTIYMRSGLIDLTGTSSVNLTAPNCITSICGVPPAIRGILFFMAPTNTNKVAFSGTADSDFMGTIYAPNNEVDLTGTSDMVTMEVQMIGKKVKVSGNVNLALNLSGAELYQIPAYIELIQ
jgi:Flp pilus assembly protein TadG